MREIRIRQMSYIDARSKLEAELNEAFMRSERRVLVVHGVGQGKLKALVQDVARGYDFCRLVDPANLAHYNPGCTVIDIDSPDRADIRRYRA